MKHGQGVTPDVCLCTWLPVRKEEEESGVTRKLARLCEHDSLHAHYVATSKKPQPICPGGEFLPEGALVIERDADGGWPVDALVWLSDLKGGRPNTRERLEPHFDALFDALAFQVGESE